MKEHDDGRMNGLPSWPQLVGMFNAIEHRLGGVQTGLNLSIEQVRLGFDRVHQRIDHLHIYGNREIDALRDRVTTLEVTPKPEQRGWIGRSGLSVKEVIGLLLLVGMSLTGTVSSDAIVAWLGH